MKKLLVVVAVLGLVFLAPASASAANGLPDGYSPSESKLREYMLNVTSKVLGGAMPQAWQREQAANQFRFNHMFWGEVNARNGYSSLNPQYLTQPGTVDEYHIKRWEQELGSKGGTNGKGFRVPATAGQKFMKGAGGALSALTMFPVGTWIGSGVSDLLGGWFGYDSQGLVCSWVKDSGDVGGVAIEILSGRQCSPFDLDGAYVPNEDLELSFTGIVAGLEYVGSWYPANYKPGYSDVALHCFKGTPSLGSNEKLWVKANNLAVSGGTSYWSSSPGTTGIIPSTSWRSSCSGPWNVSAGNYASPISMPAFEVRDLQGNVLSTFVESTGDPERRLECEVSLDDGTVLRSVGETYKESSGMVVPPPCPSVPAGKTALNVKVNEQTQQSDGTYSASGAVSDQVTTPGYQDWASSFPECAFGACKLDLIQKPKASCFDLDTACADWWDDPQKNDKYQCRYGVKDVEIDECAIYSGLFKPGRVAVGAPYSDPMTGDWSGGASAPSYDKQAMGQTIQNPAESRTCSGMAVTGFDPVGFVMRPIQCALEWAFVPRPLVIEAEMTGGEVAWEKKPPAVIASMVGSFAPAPSASGCSRSVTIFSGAFQQTVTPIDACPGSPLAPVAAISRVVTAAAMVVLVIVVLRRQVAGMIGYGAGQ